MQGTPEPETTLAALRQQFEAVRRDAGLIQDRLMRLTDVERSRALRDDERALNAEWRDAASQLTA